MIKIVPFVKDIKFNTKLSEITSISLEHDLKLEDLSVAGEFIIKGNYKINDISINKEEFNFKVPVYITLDEKYDSSKVAIDIDNFFYEIINDEVLRVHIDVSLDNLEIIKEDVKPIIEEVNKKKEEIIMPDDLKIKDDEKLVENLRSDDKKEVKKEVVEETVKKEEKKEKEVKKEESVKEEKTKKSQKEEIENAIKSNFLSEEEMFVTYKVHIIRENETVEDIVKKYETTKEELELYNDLSNVVLGTKLLIPCKNE
ncbi:MAG: hypothetical protein MR296_04040 [Tenericutes bacterium]|nr:hypothetical protein [Mycoplasmatota bacterium]